MAPASAQSAVAGADLAQAIAKADAKMHAVMERGLPGLSIAVGIRGEILWANGYGHANLELDVPATAETKFRVGSVAKPITSVALGILMDRDKLDIDAPVQTYVPTFPEKPEGVITSRLVAGHLAGIRHYLPDGSDNLDPRHYNDVVKALEKFQDDALLHPPATKYQYSSYGWNLLSAVVQGAAGESFLDFMDAEVWTPLAMEDTCPDEVTELIPNRATPYIRRALRQTREEREAEAPREYEILNAPFTDNSYKWAGGGFLSTTPDLIRFAMAVLDDDVLTEETIELLLTPMTDGEGETTHYGMGWRATQHNGEPWVGHTGGSVGGTTAFSTNRKTGLTIALVSNLSSAPVGMKDLWEVADIFDPVDGE